MKCGDDCIFLNSHQLDGAAEEMLGSGHELGRDCHHIVALEASADLILVVGEFLIHDTLFYKY